MNRVPAAMRGVRVVVAVAKANKASKAKATRAKAHAMQVVTAANDGGGRVAAAVARKPSTPTVTTLNAIPAARGGVTAMPMAMPMAMATDRPGAANDRVLQRRLAERIRTIRNLQPRQCRRSQ